MSLPSARKNVPIRDLVFCQAYRAGRRNNGNATAADISLQGRCLTMQTPFYFPNCLLMPCAEISDPPILLMTGDSSKIERI